MKGAFQDGEPGWKVKNTVEWLFVAVGRGVMEAKAATFQNANHRPTRKMKVKAFRVRRVEFSGLSVLKIAILTGYLCAMICGFFERADVFWFNEEDY
ncbi:hypothetical protein L218DRAFT_1010604 [Marasmius fiardii PR-910]|nr:hypothetical protein L218DRAFT_1010604 [Marasmius fiardii PR-910]